MTTPISFVLVTFHRPERLRKCLESVFAYLEAGDEVIVVDNGNSQAAAQTSEELGATYLAQRENLGPGPGRNIGVQMATNDLIFFLDDDAYLVSRPFTAEVERLLQRPEVGAIGFPIMELSSSQILYASHEGRAKAFAAGAFLIKAKAFHEANGFDPEIKWSEEFDLAVRLANLGHQIHNVSTPKVIHDSVNPINVPHSRKKLEAIFYGRIRTLLKSFSFRHVGVMAFRLFLTALAKNSPFRTIGGISVATLFLIRDFPEIYRERAVLRKDVELFFVRPNLIEDELSVPLSSKAWRFLQRKLPQR